MLGETSPDTGLACLLIMAQLHEVPLSAEHLSHEFNTDGSPFDASRLLAAARHHGFKSRLLKPSAGSLGSFPWPAIAKDKNGHFFIIARVHSDQVLIHDPLQGAAQTIPLAALLARWSGEVVVVQTQASAALGSSRFDFSWFIPAVVKHRGLLLEVLMVSLVLHVLSLATPLFFQVVMDKVLVHRGLSTLDVIALGLLAVTLFETALGVLRTYVFSHTTSRMDVELGSRLFRHLLGLPLGYFLARRVGDSIARVRELENIRAFLTGSTVTVILDVVFSVVFIAVMWLYSSGLTLVVLLSLPLYIVLAVLVTPVLRARLNESFTRGAENQAFLVETLTGIGTLKALAVEPKIARRWDDQLAAYVKASFRTQWVNTLANEGVGLIGKLVTVVTLWLGARLVIEGGLSVGQLIAFNMLAGRVAQPIMRLAQLWAQFQQAGVSMQRLADILDQPAELQQASRSPLPRLHGSVQFDQVTFRYRPGATAVLQQITFNIKPGEVIGVVGRSGSGKSTLTRLLQRLHVPESGRVLVDGCDLALADPTSLRRQIGVVLQDNILFNRSVRDNIALAEPAASLERVMAAAHLAGAHEFILELPEGYDTPVGEQGASLSGGQRQRIAIARALMGDPRVLIFDEATSALDYESERVIQQNMQRICAGRTVIIIAHRLNAVRRANRILVLERGQLAEQGTHEQLLALPEGIYARLHQLQQGGGL